MASTAEPVTDVMVCDADDCESTPACEVMQQQQQQQNGLMNTTTDFNCNVTQLGASSQK